MTDPAWEPPLAGSDVDHLVGTLERLRATFRWKADGLDVGRWQFTVDPDETAEGVYELWAAAVGRSRARLQELVDDDAVTYPVTDSVLAPECGVLVTHPIDYTIVTQDFTKTAD